MEHKLLISSFLAGVVDEKKVEKSHLSLFLAIYCCWQNLEFKHPINISRRKLMKLSKIRSYATYHKCIRELVELKLIRYEPSYNPTGSLIYWTETSFKY